ncbi:ATP-dependent DNA/RNA helicase DHX36-like [Paramacrobiotus metropolitanus]|uniref:ATP-dependent DNA/RNA helicase DHX36-like n=1 Tax=Paramacrobiotus metropolitanus TaxID=2943436 RepID=UPI0024457EB7|nr:ATP-dependent DNA/RNA helicase DHX36-like [Paramacrobiotus metropolitanus]
MPGNPWKHGSTIFRDYAKTFGQKFAEATIEGLNGLSVGIDVIPLKAKKSEKMYRAISPEDDRMRVNFRFAGQRGNRRAASSASSNQHFGRSHTQPNQAFPGDSRRSAAGDHYSHNYGQPRFGGSHRGGSSNVFEYGPSGGSDFSSPSTSGHQERGHAPQHPKGLRGKAAADYWRNYGRMKKAEKIANGTCTKNPKKDRSAELLRMQIPSKDVGSLKRILKAFRENPLPVLNKPKMQPKPKPACITIDETDDGDVITSWQEEEVEELEEIFDIADAKGEEENLNSVTPLSAEVLSSLSADIYHDWQKKQRTDAYHNMLSFRKKLPAYIAKEHLLKTVQDNQVCVVSGETGCGKTTQLPQLILDDYISRHEGASCRVVCTQPRRISAISVSERIAKERAENLGESVGYQIRLEKRLSRERGSILMCTTGILLQWLSSNRNLEGISHIIVDEIHEQDVLSDFLLIILKDLLPIRPTLKIILMSATINAQKFSDYFGGCPLVEIPGRIFPVQEHFLEDVLALTNYHPPQDRRDYRRRHANYDHTKEEFLCKIRQTHPRHVYDAIQDFSDRQIDYELINTLVRHIHRKFPLDEAVLIFLPGWEDIRKMNTLLESCFSANSMLIIPLHSMIPTVDQRVVFDRPVGRRKVVVATSIAETSITIDDVVHVIDTGKIKAKHFDVEKNISTLTPQWVSVSNARQRKGRAGRVTSGHCYRLYTSHQFGKFSPYPLPEIQRTPLEELCLQLKLLRLGKVSPFLQKAMEPPSEQAIQNALDLLMHIEALDDKEQLTSLGNLLARMPVPPQLGKMMYLACIFGCLNPVLNICAALSYRDPFTAPLGKEQEAQAAKNAFGENCNGDHLLVHNALEAYKAAVDRREDLRDFCWDNYMFPSTCRQILKMKGQFARILHESGFLRSFDLYDPHANRNSDNYAVVRSVIAGGLYPNLGRLRPVKHKKQTPRIMVSEEEIVSVHPKSCFSPGGVANGVYGPAVFFEKMKTTSLFAYDLSVVSPVAAFLFAKAVLLVAREKRDANDMTVVIDERLEIGKTNQETFELLCELKTAFHDVLLHIFESPARTEVMNAEARALVETVSGLMENM